MAKNPNIEDYLKNLETLIVDNVLMTRLASKGISIIRKKTLSGEYLEGSSPNAGQYSTKPLPLPFGTFNKAVQRKVLKEQIQSGEYKIFTNAKSKNTWIIIKGGYKKFRELAGKDSSKVTMSWSGRTLRNLGIVKADKTTAEIDFTSSEARQIAIYHNIMGAGKSRRKHIFMGFSSDEQAELTEMASNDLNKLLIKLK